MDFSLVDCGEVVRIKKHASGHIRVLGKSPTVQIMIEGCGLVKHRPQVKSRGKIPVPNILIECGGSIKSHSQIGDRLHIPISNILIESTSVHEGIRHVCY